MADTPPAHPAPYSDRVLTAIEATLIDVRVRPGEKILDPFAGIGRIHLLRRQGWKTYGVELEPEWAKQSPYTAVGNALHLDQRFGKGEFAVVVTSPTYGNRMADHHDARDGSHRRTYRHYLGRRLHVHNSGQMQWGENYQRFHELAWRQVAYVLRPTTQRRTGWFLLNVSDHIRRHEQVPVTAWHIALLEQLGFVLMKEIPIDTPRYRYGENPTRVENEWLLVFQSPPPSRSR